VSGETLSGIAAKYGVTLAALEKANGITAPNRIVVGQVLVIPVP
jgi:LysM repeat protein